MFLMPGKSSTAKLQILLTFLPEKEKKTYNKTYSDQKNKNQNKVGTLLSKWHSSAEHLSIFFFIFIFTEVKHLELNQFSDG